MSLPPDVGKLPASPTAPQHPEVSTPRQVRLAPDTGNSSALQQALIPFDGEIHGASLHGDTIYVAAGEKGLVGINLRSQQVHVVKAYPGKSVVSARVEDGKAYIHATLPAGKNRHFSVVELNSNKVLYSQDLDGWSSASPAPNGRFAIFRKEVITIIDPNTGKIVHTVATPGPSSGGHRVGDLLYVSHAYPGGIAIVDLNKGEVTRHFKLSVWPRGIQVVGDTACLLYGGIGFFDFNKGTLSPLATQPEDHFFRILLGPNDLFYATGRKGIYQFDDKGQLLHTTAYPKPFIDGGFNLSATPGLIGIWEDHAVLVSKHAVHVLKL